MDWKRWTGKRDQKEGMEKAWKMDRKEVGNGEWNGMGLEEGIEKDRKGGQESKIEKREWKGIGKKQGNGN